MSTASSGLNESDASEREEGSVVTMVDVLQEENELEEDANAVLGGADDNCCTYSKGYVFRQPLYACATCHPPGSAKAGGICLGCSYRCHEGHDLIELYTKRNFRCDCGNSLFTNTKCVLDPVKDDLNSSNMYNQNFNGTYCICKRPYPDPEDTVEDEMIQCVICEDWFHKRHLQSDAVPSDYCEMICHGCMGEHSFLWKYSRFALMAKGVQGEGGPGSGDQSTPEARDEPLEGAEVCRLEPGPADPGRGGPTFWPDGWRRHLCRCRACTALYERENLTFLMSETDTVQHYENANKEQAKESQYERGMKALSSLDRVKQVEAIEGYNEMKGALMGYLQKFAENRKVVREEDIREFFSQMQARKKVKIEVPYYCH